ncbi:MAG: RNA polymerase sigma factor [Bacteroidales bacterium]|nr:RNA polymerase sigma factor [Bacteroidales bacterium]
MNIFSGNGEERLIRRLRGGDTSALRDLYSEYAGYLTGVCSRYVQEKDDVKDVLQDSFVKILGNLDSFQYRGKGSLRAWMTRIVSNESLKFLSRKKKDALVPIEWDIPDEEEVEDPPLDDIPPEVIQEMIRSLPEQYRTVFNLYVLENRSHIKIAELLGIKPDTSASNLHRAKNKLAAMIKEYLLSRT